MEDPAVFPYFPQSTPCPHPVHFTNPPFVDNFWGKVLSHRRGKRSKGGLPYTSRDLISAMVRRNISSFSSISSTLVQEFMAVV